MAQIAACYYPSFYNPSGAFFPKGKNKIVVTLLENGQEIGRLLYSYSHMFRKGQSLLVAGTVRKVISEKMERNAYSIELSAPKKFKTKQAYLDTVKEM
jgi:hypothetical protein